MMPQAVSPGTRFGETTLQPAAPRSGDPDAAERGCDGLHRGEHSKTVELMQGAGGEVVGAWLVARKGGAVGGEHAEACAGEQDRARTPRRSRAGDQDVNGLGGTRVHRG